MAFNLLPNATTNGSSPVKDIANNSRGQFRNVKVAITVGSATVVFEGRMGPADTNWVTLFSTTASVINAVVLPPQIRATVSGISGGGVVDVWVDGYET